jgi:hypothetical protein
MISLSERKTTVAGPKNHTTNYQINIAKFSVHLEYWTSLRWLCNGQQIDVVLNVQFYHSSKKNIFQSKLFGKSNFISTIVMRSFFSKKSNLELLMKMNMEIHRQLHRTHHFKRKLLWTTRRTFNYPNISYRNTDTPLRWATNSLQEILRNKKISFRSSDQIKFTNWPAQTTSSNFIWF